MPAISASAPGKIIVFGEHAVVYHRPAIAAPVSVVAARAIIRAEPGRFPGGVRIQAPGIGLETELDQLPQAHPLAAAVAAACRELGVARLPACTIRITSTIPVAAGLGSGAAVSVALIRALSSFLGRPLPDERVNALAYEVETIHHGTPSGIDNTVITYRRAVYFFRDRPIEFLQVPRPFTIVIGDTGIASPTAAAVTRVRQSWQADPPRYERLFDRAGQVAEQARRRLEGGEPQALGSLMDENHAILCELGVSSPELDRLVAAARAAGALGAKLSGGGRGGNMIALPAPGRTEEVARALAAAGARRTLITEIHGA